jgi:hypothetical protein
MASHAPQLAASPEATAQSVESRSIHEQIASLAYVLWQQRGCPEGSSEEDWFKAEQKLLARSEA